MITVDVAIIYFLITHPNVSIFDDVAGLFYRYDTDLKCFVYQSYNADPTSPWIYHHTLNDLFEWLQTIGSDCIPRPQDLS